MDGLSGHALTKIPSLLPFTLSFSHPFTLSRHNATYHEIWNMSVFTMFQVMLAIWVCFSVNLNFSMTYNLSSLLFLHRHPKDHQ